MANGNGLGGAIHQGAGLAIGATLALGGIAWLAHHIGIIPHEFVLAGGLFRGCCSKHPHHTCGGCPWHGRPMHHVGYEAMVGTQNTLGFSGGGKYHLY